MARGAARDGPSGVARQGPETTHQDNARCAYRTNNDPDNRNDNNGFGFRDRGEF